ncbi:polysaccharide pyruvyl transferase family protein [Pseudooceanicola nanhaiensis]|uniref:polysaccharide pyruvyl transferase family protein n=1 Tax=Pseudooceanicola nanhaiensis TaxID=375761 RepID=UPI001CD1FFAE|nr:polysaccharide pyruvyl transferase family protein [Pseudooceanicola nanhaiensis]MCA0921710.1 polysaccharide pyruvyl transferase family protein [Pseudooceanicola nanhaiensis]
MKVVQFGLHYSPNLGDGIIAECLAHGIATRAPGAEVVTIDISGRQGFDEVVVKNRQLVMKVLGLMPLALRQRVVLAKLGPMVARFAEGWQQELEGADLAVVGGGQILSDADLNFCIKLSAAARAIRAGDVPAAIFAAGVSKNWTAKGRALFLDLLATDLRMVGLRDAPSIEAWRSQTGNPAPQAVLTRDPGLLAAACYGAPAQRPGGIGICCTDPALLAYHADAEVAGGGSLHKDLVLALIAAGHRVTLFSNGAEEDAAFQQRLGQEMADLVSSGALTMAAVPTRPGGLAHLVAGFDAVVAHRLHACIIAHSYGLPVVGLGWDRKVESFFASVGQEAAFVGAAEAGGASVAEVLEAAMARGIDPDRHARVQAEAWEAIDRLLACV